MAVLTPRNVYAPGREPPKREIIQLLEQMIEQLGGGPFVSRLGDYRGTWDVDADYLETDFVESGGSLWYAKDDSTGVSPVEGPAWTLLLPGVSVADGAVTWAKLSPDIQQTAVYAETFGLAFDNNTASAAANSAAFQAAVDYLEARGGGVLRFGGGGDDYCYLDAVPIVPARVSLRGNDGYGTRFRKYGSTRSTEFSTSVPRWGDATVAISIASPGVVTMAGHGLIADDAVKFSTTGALPTGLVAGTTYYVKTVLTANTFTLSATPGGTVINTSGGQSGTHTGRRMVGSPICVIQFGNIGGINWSGECEHISVFGNDLDIDTTTTQYGFFFAGMSTGRVHRCTAEYVQNGFCWSAGNTILSNVTMCVTNWTLRGFYQEFATSTLMASNFAARSKYLGYSWSAHYSTFASNAADHNGEGASATEIALVYEISGCFGGHVQDNGAEFSKGSVMRLSGNRDLTVCGNVALAHGSDYTGSGDVVGMELGSNNINLKVYDNQFELDTPTGTAGRHFNWKVSDVQFGEYLFLRNRFYNDWTTAGVSTGWTNTSGDLRTDRGTCTVTLVGVTTTETGTAEWRCEGSIVTLTIPGLAGTSNTTDCTITGLPSALAPSAHRYPIMVMLDNGNRLIGRAWVHTNGSIYLLPTSNSTNTFTNTGVKGIYDSTITYSL